MPKLTFLACAALGIAACNDSSGIREPLPRPTVIDAQPREARVTCSPTLSGACALTITVVFRLPEDQFIWKAYLRFQTDGTELGVDRGYLLERKFGKGDQTDVSVVIPAEIPPTVVASGELSYSVRLVTGLGEESDPINLRVVIP